MKKKLTLSLEPSHIAMLRKASLRKKKSISQLVEDFAENIDTLPNDDEPGILKWAGFWGKYITPEDFETDDKAGEQMRMTQMYKNMKKKRRAK